MLRSPKNLRIGYYCILVRSQIRGRVRVLQFVAGHLPFEPHSDSVNYKQVSFVKYRRLCALQVITKDTDVKKDWRRSYVASFVTEIVFKAKLDSRTGE